MYRYRCRCCGRTFCSDARVIGLAKWARRNKPLNDSIISASADGVFKEHPMVKAAYDFKTRLCELLNLKNITKRTSKPPPTKNSEK